MDVGKRCRDRARLYVVILSFSCHHATVEVWDSGMGLPVIFLHICIRVGNKLEKAH